LEVHLHGVICTSMAFQVCLNGVQARQVGPARWAIHVLAFLARGGLVSCLA
jgi:hypothetical protein